MPPPNFRRAMEAPDFDPVFIATIIEIWGLLFQRQLEYFNPFSVIALDRAFFNTLSGSAILALFELYFAVVGRDAGFVKCVVRQDMILLGSIDYFSDFELVATPEDAQVLTIINFDMMELSDCESRLLRAIEDATRAFAPAARVIVPAAAVVEVAPEPVDLNAAIVEIAPEPVDLDAAVVEVDPAVEDVAPVIVENAPAVIHGRAERIPRPPNAFILYRQSMNVQVKLENPELHNNERSKIIGLRWAREPQTVRDDWLRKANLVKEAHNAAFPGYRYQPRKSAEKKRRMSRKRAIAAANAEAHHVPQVPVPAEQTVFETPNGSVSHNVSVTVNDGERFYYHAENDFRPAPPGPESLAGMVGFHNGENFFNNFEFDHEYNGELEA